MAVGGDNYNNISDFPDLFLDNLLLEETTTESQLCIPQDSLDGLELYPNFSDDSICLSELLLTPEHKTLFHGVLDDVPPHAAKLEPEDSRLSFGGFPEQQQEEEEAKDDNKTQETEKKRGLKRARSRKNRLRRSWSCKDPKFVSSSENQVASGVGEKRRRRCSHCETEETPQWRVGPEGPNSLCNACGVRYKSGRLVPEYRPAASPSFDISKHSNFHRKIIKRKGGEERRGEQSHV